MRRSVLLASLLVFTTGCATRSEAVGAIPGLVEAAGAPPGTEIRFFLLAGQSNMAGRGEVAGVDQADHARVFMLTRNRHWAPAREPLHFDKPDIAGVGPGLAFGRAVAAAEPGILVGLIPAAVGGSAISAWAPGGYDRGTDSYPFDAAMRRTTTAIGTGHLDAVLWHQGESDSSSTAAARRYAGELKRVISQLRESTTSAEALFLVGGLHDEILKQRAGARIIQSVLEDIGSEIPGTGFVSASGLRDTGDGVHFDAASARELGQRYARVYLAMRKGSVQ